MTDSDPPNDPDTAQAARDWIMRLASGEITEAELAAYRRWAADPAHDAVFEHELALWRSLGAIGDRLAPSGPPPSAKSAGRARLSRAGYAGAAIAACLAIMMTGPELVLRARADHHTGVAVQSLTLPDGSRAVLDAGSAITVRYDGEQRLVELLRGRAWFDVVHDERKPFRVAAMDGMVEDIGTAFAVGEEDGTVGAAVTEGVIRVRSPGESARWMTLRAGQRASWSRGGTPAREADITPSRIAVWRENDILLDGVAVRAAIREIGRYRPGPTLVMGRVDDLPRVTAIVRAERPDEGLDALAASARLEILRLPGGIAIVRPAR